jgi:hypothetical protein
MTTPTRQLTSQPIINVVIRFSRRTIEAEKIAFQSLIDMPEQNEYTQRAIARLSKRIEAQEKMLRGER